MIYNKLILTISAFILIGSTCVNNQAFAIEFGEIKYNNAPIDYEKIDKESTLKLADFYFKSALASKNPEERKKYLQKASGEYFILSKTNPGELYPIE